MMLPSSDYRKTQVADPRKLHRGLDALVYGLVGFYHRRDVLRENLLAEAAAIHDRSEHLKTLSTKDLEGKLRAFKSRFRRKEDIDNPLVAEALATLVETAERTLGLRPYPVQVAGALALYRGYLAEMATGEGKSLTACLPAALSAWTGRPCHVVTVNDYLAARDVAEMKSFYERCGLSVGAVTADMAQNDRRAGYDKGVVYTTSKELAADFLRDRLILGPIQNPSRRLIRGLLHPQARLNEGMVMRGLHTAIVDEADSVLIDEAVTPLIISRPQDNKPFMDVCMTAHRLSKTLKPVRDYICDMKYKDIRFTKEGEKKLDDMASELKGLWRSRDRREELILQALTAREFYKRDKQYVVKDGKVVIVDEFTGRLMPNRTWRQGFHQAVEAKENIEITRPSETLSRLSFQQFFRLFENLSGMTGTGLESSREFWQIYGLAVMAIPTHRPCIREQYPNLIFATAHERWNAVVDEVAELHRVGRPVLVGTRNVAASETIAARLAEKGFAFSLLNAVHHQEEAGIVRSAGQEGRITIATNMAGRGTDIKLGEGVTALGGLHVIATEGHESARIDRQLFGRSARQGDPGSARAFMSMEDELMVRFVPAPVRNRLALSLGPNHPSVQRFAEKVYRRAQKSAQNMAFKQRKSVLRMDTWLEEALAFTGKSVLGG